MNFAVNFHYEGTNLTTLAPSIATGETESTAPLVSTQSQGYLVSTTAKSGTTTAISSYCRPDSCTGGQNGYCSVVLRKLSEKEFLSSGVLRSMRSFMDMVVTLYIILLEWWAMATGSSEDSKTTQWIQDSRERTWTRTRRQSSRKRQRQNKKHGWRLLRTAQLLTLAAVFCLADHGSKCARSDPEGDTSGSIQTGGWIDPT